MYLYYNPYSIIRALGISSTMATPNPHRKHPAKIIGIQFSILSPEEIRKGSVAEINNRNPYNNNKPTINGLFDPRMGVLEPSYVCPTDGLKYMETPGYFGHIELARPMFYVQYLDTVVGVLKCVCLKCSKLFIEKTGQHEVVYDLNPKQRWEYVSKACASVTRCGQKSRHGCGCLKPTAIESYEYPWKLRAKWTYKESVEGQTGKETRTQTLDLSAEIVLKVLSRMSDEDISFMGFSPEFSRPEWMICQVFAVPPPAVRPSVRMDSQQRSEDDLTHVLINVIKANETLLNMMQPKEGVPPVDDRILDTISNQLQYYLASMVDNKIPGVDNLAQRNGRPIKSIKERISTKQGRVRGNLMGKRVDFSARSVITPDPNLSIKELGVPKLIAMNITVPVVVNPQNRAFLQRLVQNGPDKWPGANRHQRGNEITYLRVNTANIQLKDGDVVHRHMLDGDAVLFNRQPTLHRMNMMCHIAKIMPVGHTFRMNVGDTKPYNADFDGDEMNMHMPQDAESEIELRCLAAVPYQLISPGNHKPIIGIYQDSLIGSFRFTRPNIKFNAKQAMSLLAACDTLDLTTLVAALKTGSISNFDILTQLLPVMSLNMRDKQGEMDIVNGIYLQGQLNKDKIHKASHGLIHRICNDFGNMRAVKFIDDLQNVVTEYMKTSAYSVGVSDLVIPRALQMQIKELIQKASNDVRNLIDKTHLGLFDGKTASTKDKAFEMEVSQLLEAGKNEAEKIVMKELKADNRFLQMVQAGSKGSMINIMQMLACLGAVAVEGARVKYGFESRALPHFSKYDDSAEARGFVTHSFIEGLLPHELFYHAMGGRIGLIDTAVKTSDTGYLQRQMVKCLEDLKVEYDMTVRNHMQKIVQYAYGDDGIDPVKVERQAFPLCNMTLEQIYQHFYIPLDRAMLGGVFESDVRTRITNEKNQEELKKALHELIQQSIRWRDLIAKHVMRYDLGDGVVNVPVAFTALLANFSKRRNLQNHVLCDVAPLEAMQQIDACFARLMNLPYAQPTDLFKAVYYFHLNPQQLLVQHRLSKADLIQLLQMVELMYYRALIAPGEMSGIIAAQSIGEPTTQLTLNTFHMAGVAAKTTVTQGLPRLREILRLTSPIKKPSCEVYLPPYMEADPTFAKEEALQLMARLEYCPLRTVVSKAQICYDPMNHMAEDDLLIKQYSMFSEMMGEETTAPCSNDAKWVLRLTMNATEMLDRGISMEDVNFALQQTYGFRISCVFSDFNSDSLIFRIRIHSLTSLQNNRDRKVPYCKQPIDASDEIHILKCIQDNMLDNVVLRGVRGITKANIRTIKHLYVLEDGVYRSKDKYVLDTEGSNLMELLALDFVDSSRTVTNDIQEIHDVFGVEATYQSIYNEMVAVMSTDSKCEIDHHHLSLLCSRMTDKDELAKIFRSGQSKDDIGAIAKASFEETPGQFLSAAVHAELDNMRGVSANIMCGQEGYYGTSAFQVMLDYEQLQEQLKHEAQQKAYETYEPTEPLGNKLRQEWYSAMTTECSEQHVAQDLTNYAGMATATQQMEIDAEEAARLDDYVADMQF